MALGIATRENSAAVVFILDFDDDLCPGGLGAPIDCVCIRHAAGLTHAQLSPWASLINRRPVIEPKASRSPRFVERTRVAAHDVVGVQLPM